MGQSILGLKKYLWPQGLIPWNSLAGRLGAFPIWRKAYVAVETIPTPHDGVDGVVFVVDDGKHRLGILTDLGHVFAGLGDVKR